MLLSSILMMFLAFEDGGLSGVLPLGNEAVNQLYREQQYEEALQRYLELYERDPESGVLAYNIGNTYAALGDLAKAGEYFEKAAEGNDELARNRAKYNLGNLQMNSQQFGEAVKRYIDYLQENPDDIDAKRNLEIALRQMQQQPPQQQQNQDQQDEQDQQDQENQQPSESQSQNSSENESQQDQSQQNASGESQEESSKSEQEQNQPQEPQGEQQSQPQGDPENQPPQPKDEKGQEQQQPQPSDKEMDEQLKQQILEALNEQERQQQKQHQMRKAGANKRRAKDW